MKVSLNINQQNGLAEILQQMSEKDEIVPGEAGPRIVKVSYKLGAAGRRALTKNIGALRVSLQAYNETRVSLVREFWPALPDGEAVKREDDPETFARYLAELQKVVDTKEEIELQQFTDKSIFDDNEYPLAVTAALDELGLIDSSAA